MKIKVEVTRLIERVQRSKERELRAHDRKVERALELEPPYRDHVVSALFAAFENARNGGELPGEHARYIGNVNRRYLLVPIKGRRRPASPGPFSTQRHDKRLAELALESRAELVIDPDSSDWRGLL